MDLLKKLREDHGLSDLLCDVCDVKILPEFKIPQNEEGHVTYNIAGKTFSKACSGSEYILLEDGSIGYWGSEGECGRIADNLNDFFELMINCPYWLDYVCEEKYQNKEELSAFAKEIFEEYMDSAQADGVDLCEAQQKLADRLGIEIKSDVTELLMRFYHCAKRSPRFIQTYTENDGSVHSGTGSLFDR